MSFTKEVLLQNIKARTISQIIEGVERFPKPFQAETFIQLPEDENLSAKISQCVLCSLAKSRNHVVVSKVIQPKKYFILADFPDSIEDKSGHIFSEKSPLASLILNLLGKIGIINESYFSYAIKCFPQKALSTDCLNICVQNHLLDELKNVAPEYVFCFGYRAMKGLYISLKVPFFFENINENSKLDKLELSGKSIQPFFLPSIKELYEFPHWRKQVWDLLTGL
ncbi:hypothetical protein QEJ31_13110 [Pigmentibacter sp. JX0631]|uniref:uracil-DNA glycosylase family protein n=1 Tax=Pigmentibacter sp. JX0631 TaxID=2976982 RepID=UPI0024682DBA|nr:uracil-DNA glycosylase family protein [Pigmentibacter sp. JX0631]WGL59463.1 hypothetical protein QEJ31_13110 [Pigmentibacter sp. JX0631]